MTPRKDGRTEQVASRRPSTGAEPQQAASRRPSRGTESQQADQAASRRPSRGTESHGRAQQASSREPSKGAAGPHPCLQTAIVSSNLDKDSEKLQWWLHEEFEAQKVSLEEMLSEHRRIAAAEVAVHLGRLEEDLRLRCAGLDGAAKRLESQVVQQAQSVKELLGRSLLQGTGRRPSGQADDEDSQAQLIDGLSRRLHAENEQSLQAHFLRVEELLRKPGGRRPSHTPSGGTRPSRTALRSRWRGDLYALEAATGCLNDHRSSTSMPELMAGPRRASTTSKEPPHSLDKYLSLIEAVSSVLILLNCIWMGVEADVAMTKIWADATAPQWLSSVNFVFAGLFLMELIARLSVQGWRFFGRPYAQWNLFDSLLILVQVIDVTVDFYNVSFLRAFRIVRIFRAARIIRMMSSVRQLRVLVACLTGSFVSLFWTAVLLLVIIYLGSTSVLQSLQVYVELYGAGSLPSDVAAHYGSLANSMLALFYAISGGAPWGSLMEPLAKLSKTYEIAFVLYYSAVVFGVLNIVAALFVESTARFADVDSAMEVREQALNEESTVNRLRRYLAQANVESTRWLSETELMVKLDDPQFATYLQGLGVDTEEAVGIFRLLDSDSMGLVDVDEFVYALMRLKSRVAKSVDLATMLYQNKRILLRQVEFMKFVGDKFKELRRALEVEDSVEQVFSLPDYAEDLPA